MKKKKLKKIAHLLHIEVENYRRKREEMYAIKEISIHNHICEFDEEVSNKIFNFILNLIKLQSKISIDYQENYINLHCNLNQFRKSNSNYPTKEESIDINVDKSGFKIRKDYDNYISYQDPLFLDKLKPHLMERYRNISKDTINEIMDDVMVLTNLSRENNLDELLNS